MTENMIEKLNAEAKYLQISLPYDKEDHLITFDDGMMTELECDDDFAPHTAGGHHGKTEKGAQHADAGTAAAGEDGALLLHGRGR